MTQVNSHSRALVEVDDLDISHIPADANLIVGDLETEADILNKLNEAIREPLSKYLFDENEMNHINNLTDFYLGLSDMQYERTAVIEQAIADIRKYQDRMSINGRAIQHIADSLEELVK